MEQAVYQVAPETGSGTVLGGPSLQSKEQHQGTNEDVHLSCLLSRRESSQDEVTTDKGSRQTKVPGPSLPKRVCLVGFTESMSMDLWSKSLTKNRPILRFICVPPSFFIQPTLLEAFEDNRLEFGGTGHKEFQPLSSQTKECEGGKSQEDSCQTHLGLDWAGTITVFQILQNKGAHRSGTGEEAQVYM